MSELNPLSQVPLSTSGPLWQRIFRYLDPPDLGRCERVCKSWRHLLTDHTDAHKVWQVAHNRQFAPLNCADPKQVKDRVITHWCRTHFRPLTEEAKPEYKVIYGDTDSRKNLHDLDGDSAFTSLSSQIKCVAKSVACIIHQNCLVLDPIADRYRLSDTVPILGERLFAGLQLGSEERFLTEKAPGYGTAFLVAKDLVLTAAHCVCQPDSNEIDLKKLRESYFLFDFATHPDGSCVAEFGKTSVYRFKEVIARRFVSAKLSTSQDWALLRLRTPTKDREPLTINFNWQTKVGQQIFMLGHPLGLPMKFTGMAEVGQTGGERALEIGTTLDAFKGNSGSPIFTYDGQELIVAAMLVRGQKDFKVQHNYRGTGQQRIINNRVREGWQTGLRIERLDFLRGFLSSIKAVNTESGRISPGLNVEGICERCGPDHAIIPVSPREDFTFSLKEIQHETQCLKGHRLLAHNVKSLAFAHCRYRIEARNFEDFRISYEDHLKEGMLLRFELSKWHWMRAQVLPLIPPYQWPAPPGQSRCSVEETADGLCFVISREGQDIRLNRDQVEGWISSRSRAWRHPNPEQNAWHPVLRRLRPHIAPECQSVTFGICELPIEGGSAVGYLDANQKLSWKLFINGTTVELAPHQVAGLAPRFSEPTFPDLLATLSCDITDLYSACLQHKPLLLQFQAKATGADTAPTTSPEQHYLLGLCYQNGTGVEKDEAEAARLFKLATDQGYAKAQFSLGVCYENGAGVEKDEDEAARLYELAAGQKHARAQCFLGLCYTYGRGVEKDEAEAARLYKLAAEQGDAAAQRNLGVCYAFGEGVEKDEAEAARLYRLAADQGHARAQCNLGICYHLGEGVEKDEAEAVRLYKLAAEQGDAAAQRNLGFCYKYGTGVEKDEAEAVRLYKLAVEQGHARAQCNLGVCYEDGAGVEKDEAEAVRLYKLAADQGHARGQCNLGVCYEYGTGVEKDEAEAARLYRLAADQGHARAQCNLGVCYEDGAGVEKDEAEAVRLYKLAVEQGHARAQCNLGFCYHLGEGVEKDEAEAVRLFKLAADQGDAAAQCNLGVCFANGTGVEKDEAEAARLFKLAADQGYAMAQCLLGICYTNGTGVEKDEAEAARLYRLAADQGHVHGDCEHCKVDKELKEEIGIGRLAQNQQGGLKQSKSRLNRRMLLGGLVVSFLAFRIWKRRAAGKLDKIAVEKGRLWGGNART